MFYRTDFVTCITETMASKNYGTQKINEAIDYYDRQQRIHATTMNPDDAASKAIVDVFTEMQYRANAKAKVARNNLAVMATNNQRIQMVLDGKIRTNLFKALVNDITGFNIGADSPGNALGHALMSGIEDDPRFPGSNMGSTYRGKLGQYWANMDAVMGKLGEKFAKGAFGRTIGLANHADVVNEFFYQALGIGKPTGNSAASDIVKAIVSTDKLMFDDYNNSGGVLRWLDGYFPQGHSQSKIILAGVQTWARDITPWLDWNKMRWPDGTLIQPAERAGFLSHVGRTLASDGRSDIEPSLGHGQGASLSSQSDKHRVLVFKDAPSWLAYHDKYADGNVFDVIANHIHMMARKTALVSHFGDNPAMMAKTSIQQAQKAASVYTDKVGATKAEKRAESDLDSVVTRYKQMMDLTLHANPMNPNSAPAAMVMGTSHLLGAALLGSVPLISQAGDLATMMAVRLANHEPLIAGLSMYLKGVTTGYKDLQEMSLQTGFVHDNVVQSNYAATRLNSVATLGPAWTKRVGDWSMSLSLLNRETYGMRGVAQLERMGHMWRDRTVPFDQLENKAVFERYGIDAAAWDAVRKNVSPYTPRNGVNFMDPINILNIKHADKETLFRKFFTMIDAESRAMVPGATLEAAATLRGTSRPDTLAGALLYSFGMFKNYPITIFNAYGRRALAQNTSASRLKFLTALGVSMIASGAIAVQMREISHGREPMDLTSYKFWTKAVLASGGLSIWGDMLFGGQDQQPDVAATFGGPLAGLGDDLANITVGSAYQWIDAMDAGKPYGGKWSSKITEFAKRYNPLASNWFLRPVLEHEVFDTLQRWIDPVGARKRETAAANRQTQIYGNKSFLPPGPLFGGQ